MAYTQMNANSASVVAATDEVTYDKYWLQHMRIMAPDPSQNVKVVARFIPCKDDGETKVLMTDGEPQIVTINDLLGDAESDSNLAAAVDSVLVELNKIGINQGVFTSS